MVTLSLAGDAEAQRQLAIRLLDAVHRVVAARVGAKQPETIQTRVQEVFVALLERDAEELRRWDPEDGPTLEECATLLARRRIRILLGEPQDADEDSAGDVPWTPLSGAEREAVLAKIVARLDHGETLAEAAHEIRERDLDEPADLPTKPGVERPQAAPEGAPLRFTVLQIGITVAIAIAIASAVAVWAG
jgi:hypothetical protein